MRKASPCLARRTLACVSTSVVASPARSQANENAIVKHAACAAPRISSGSVCGASKRLAKPYGYSFERARLGADLAWPCLPWPCQWTLSFRSSSAPGGSATRLFRQYDHGGRNPCAESATRSSVLGRAAAHGGKRRVLRLYANARRLPAVGPRMLAAACRMQLQDRPRNAATKDVWCTEDQATARG